MGSGIAEVCARRGLDVVVIELDSAAAQRGRTRIARSMESAVARGRLSAEDRERAASSLYVTAEFDRLSDRDIVIEAVSESPPTKVEALRQIDRVLDLED